MKNKRENFYPLYELEFVWTSGFCCDENSTDINQSASKKHSSILIKEDFVHLAKNNEEELKKIVLKDALFVPDNSKLKRVGVDVSIGEKLGEFLFQSDMS